VASLVEEAEEEAEEEGVEMSIFAGIENAEVSNGGQNFRPGLYQMVINEVTTFQSRKGPEYFLVKATVERTTSDAYSPGSQIDWLVNLNQDWAMSNVKEFALALIPAPVIAEARAKGQAHQLVTSKTIEEMIGPDQPCEGVKVDVNAVERISKATGNPWTHARWQAAGTLTFAE
jgi:hypothetical protein